MSKLISFVLICTLFLVSATATLADQIILKNGDKITGTIVKKDGDSIVIKTESAGLVTVVWAAVERIVSDAKLNVTLADGQLIKGKVDTENNKVSVQTDNAGTVAVDKEKINIVRSDAEQANFEAAQERLRNPGLGDLWNGNADLGYAMTSGNSSTSTFTAAISAARATSRDKISVYANAIKASNKTSGTSVTSANALWYGARYDVNISDKAFAFGAADFEHNKPQKLRVRSSFGAGLGYRAIRSEKTQLDLFAGAAYTLAYFTNNTRSKGAELLFGDELKHKINSRMSFSQRWVVYPGLTNKGVRSNFDASLVTNLNDWLGWHVTVGNRYNSKPAVGAKNSDNYFSTGLRASFGRKN
jgi:putative salt-induced outer membrane protein YdiY